MDSRKILSVIILNWNGERLLREFLPSVVANTQGEEGKAIWLDENSEVRWLTSHDGLELHGLYLPQETESHRYAVI